MPDAVGEVLAGPLDEGGDEHVRGRAEDRIRVDVQATGLNFRDVMYALGLLSDEALEQGFAGPTLGLEFAGTLISK